MGKHARKTSHNKTIATAVVLTAGGMAATSTPASAATVDDWERVAECESNNLWNRPDGDFGKSSGGLQFQPASWSDALSYLRSKGVDTSGYPQGPGHQAYRATKQQQIIAGEALLALQGPGAWTCNAKVGSPLQSSGSHASMFKGGTNPYYTPPSLPPVRPVLPPAPKPVSPPPKPAPKAHPVAASHTVVKGDTLWGISAKHLGTGLKWKLVYEHNQGKIKDPHWIYPGQVFTLPGGTKAVPQPVVQAKPKPPAPPAAPAVKATGKVYPVAGVDSTTNPYGAPRSGYTLGYHTGVDFTAPQGTVVRAAKAGTVVSSDGSSAYGINVQIKHDDGTYTLYAHLSGKVAAPGQAVAAGQTIGYVGSTGVSSGPHLHFEVRTAPRFGAGNFLNPQAWLRS